MCSKCKRQGDSIFRVLMKFVSVTLQMKATEMYIPVLLFVTLYKGGSNFRGLRIKSYSMTIQMKANEQHFPVTLTLPLLPQGILNPDYLAYHSLLSSSARCDRWLCAPDVSDI